MNNQSLDQMIADNRNSRKTVKKQNKRIRKVNQNQIRSNRNIDRIRVGNRNDNQRMRIRGGNRIRQRDNDSQRINRTVFKTRQVIDGNKNKKRFFSSDLNGSQNKRVQSQSRISRGRLMNVGQRRQMNIRQQRRGDDISRLGSLRSNYQMKRGINTNRSTQQNNNRRRPIQQNERRIRDIKVSGLNLKINNQELFDLFSEFGPLVKCNINYDSLGRSKGNAIIRYENLNDGQTAIKKYNYAELDNHKLRLEFIKSKITKTIKK